MANYDFRGITPIRLPNDGTGSGLIPGPGTITNAMLVNDDITINTSGTVSGGGVVALGGTLNLVGSSLPPTPGSITNAMLVNDDITINTSGTVSGGGVVALGGTLNLVGNPPAPGSITNAMLQNNSVTINTSGTVSGGGVVALGGTLNLVGAAVAASLTVAARTMSPAMLIIATVPNPINWNSAVIGSVNFVAAPTNIQCLVGGTYQISVGVKVQNSGASIFAVIGQILLNATAITSQETFFHLGTPTTSGIYMSTTVVLAPGDTITTNLTSNLTAAVANSEGSSITIIKLA